MTEIKLYRVDRYGKITKHEVVKVMPKTIEYLETYVAQWYPEQIERTRKKTERTEGSHHKFFETFDECRQWLIECENKIISELEARIEYRKKKIREYEKLKEGEG